MYNKLQEARYFLKCMRNNKGNQYEFDYHLSAFLSASRSVLQYIHKEVQGKKEKQAWFDKMMSDNKILGLFKNLRDDNIHEEAIDTIKHARSNGRRIHYFNTKSTQKEVLLIAEEYIALITNLLDKGKKKGYY